MKRRILRVLGFGLGAVALLAILLGVTVAVFFHKFNPDPPSTAASKPANSLQAQRQDLGYFRALTKMDRSFTPAARAEAERRIAHLEVLDTPLSRQRLHVELMQIMALAGNGHTRMDATPAGAELDLLPVRVAAFSDGLYVMHARDAYADLLGGRVEAINGVPVATVMRELDSLRGGVPAFRRSKAAVYVAVQDLVNGLGIAPDPTQVVWTVRLPSGAVVARTLAAYPRGADEPLPDAPRWMSPESLAGMKGDWRGLRPAGGSIPPTLQNFDTPFVLAPVADSCASYLRLRAISDAGDQRIRPFLDDAEASLRARRPCAVILDLRYNDGGNYMNTYGFMHALPGLVAPGGHVYVLTDPTTFSAAITTAAFVKQAGGDRVILLGEPVGDRLAFFAEGNRGCLPNSRLCVRYATGKHDYAHACKDWNVCYWLNWLYPVRVRTLAPDEVIATSFADWNAGRDPAYERAVQLSKRSPS